MPTSAAALCFAGLALAPLWRPTRPAPRLPRQAVPSWSSLASRLPSSRAPEPLVHDSVLDPKKPKLSGLVLFRERNGWCPYSERVWLALEMKGIGYDTVLIDNMGSRPRWFSGQTPQVRWASGAPQGESLDILRRLDKEYPGAGPRLFRDKVDEELVDSFRRIFPRNTRPSSRAAFLFKGYAGMPVWRAEFEETLEKTDALLAERGGPFFRGQEPSAADVAWAPFLERYSYQLPCLHAGLNPRDESRWPALARWYTAMEEEVPCYSSRVQGDDVSWRRVLAQAGFGNSGVAPVLVSEEEAPERTRVEGRWGAYVEARPHMAASPAEEAAARVVRNKEALAKDAVAQGALEAAKADEALRGLAAVLAGELEEGEAGEGVKAAARYLDERMCVPRDMGLLPGRAIRELARRLGGAA